MSLFCTGKHSGLNLDE